MNKKQKGEIAELKVQLAAMEKGWVSSKPTCTARYDLILDDGKQLYRTQVKYAGAVAQKCQGAVHFSSNNGPHSPVAYVKDEIDLVLVYIPQIDQIVQILPEEFHGKTAFQIRLEPPKNGQKRGIFLAEDHLW